MLRNARQKQSTCSLRLEARAGGKIGDVFRKAVTLFAASGPFIDMYF